MQAESVPAVMPTTGGVKTKALAERLRSPDFLAVALIVVVGLELAITRWAHWGTPLVDCGREMYVPWQILQGNLLYRDLWYLYGPLAPYLKAFLFALFGVHLNVLYGLGISLAVGTGVTLYRLGKDYLPRLGAISLAICFLLQAFEPGTIWNFILPYSYAAALGTLLGLLCLEQTLRHVQTGNRKNLVWASVLAALSILNKQEFGVVCYLTVTAAVLLRSYRERAWGPARQGFWALLPGLAAAGCVYGFFAWKTGWHALMLENFQQTPQSYFMQKYGKQWLEANGFGLNSKTIQALWRSALIAAMLWWVAGHSIRNILRMRAIGWVTLGGFFYAALRLQGFLPNGVFLWIVVMGLTWTYKVARGDSDRLSLLIIALYAGLCGMRVFGALMSGGYGLFYNTAAMLLFFYGISRLVSHERLVVQIVMLLPLVGLLYEISNRTFITGDRLSTTRGTLYLDSTLSSQMEEALDFVAKEKAAGRDVIMLPEAGSLYFLGGHQAIHPWYHLTPGLFEPERETNYIQRLAQRNPEVIMISNRGYPEYKAAKWGEDCYVNIYAWITNHYRLSNTLGVADEAAASTPGGLKMRVYRRN